MDSQAMFPFNRVEPILNGYKTVIDIDIQDLYFSIMTENESIIFKSGRLTSSLKQIRKEVEDRLGSVQVEQMQKLGSELYGITQDDVAKFTLLPDNYDSALEYDKMHAMGLKNTETKVKNYVYRRYVTILSYLYVLSIKPSYPNLSALFILRLIEDLAKISKPPLLGFERSYAKFDTISSIIDDPDILQKVMYLLNNVQFDSHDVLFSKQTQELLTKNLETSPIPVIHEIYRHKHTIELIPVVGNGNKFIESFFPKDMIVDHPKIIEVDSFILPFLAGTYRNVLLHITYQNSLIYTHRAMIPTRESDYYQLKEGSLVFPHYVQGNKVSLTKPISHYTYSHRVIEESMMKMLNIIHQGQLSHSYFRVGKYQFDIEIPEPYKSQWKSELDKSQLKENS